MKKSKIAIVLAFMLLSLVGCNKKSMNYIVDNKPSVTGTVKEVNDKYIQIYIENDMYPQGADCNVSLDVENTDGSYSPINVGDEVVVYYDGGIAESYPMQINKVYAITLLKSATRKGEYMQISMQEAAVMLEEETGHIILDVRTPEEFADNHIPGAINIPNETIGTAEIAQLPDKKQKIFVYCRSGNRSKQASEKLVAQGYVNVIEFGGIIDWTGETVSEKRD